MSCLNAFVSESFTLVWVPSDACRIAGIAKKVVWDQPHSLPFFKSFWAWPRVEYKRQMWLWHKSAPNKDKVWKEERPLQEWKCKNCSEVGTELSGSWKELSHHNKKKIPFLCLHPFAQLLVIHQAHICWTALSYEECWEFRKNKSLYTTVTFSLGLKQFRVQVYKNQSRE